MITFSHLHSSAVTINYVGFKVLRLQNPDLCSASELHKGVASSLVLAFLLHADKNTPYMLLNIDQRPRNNLTESITARQS